MTQHEHTSSQSGKLNASASSQRRQPPPYRCRFCNEYLHPAEERFADLWKRFFLFRTFQCPHCFGLYDRPLSMIGSFRVVRWFFRPSRRRVRRNLVDEHRENDQWSPSGFLARFGRMISRADRRFTDYLSSTLLSFVAVFVKGRRGNSPSAWRKFANWISGRRR